MPESRRIRVVGRQDRPGGRCIWEVLDAKTNEPIAGVTYVEIRAKVGGGEAPDVVLHLGQVDVDIEITTEG